MRRLERRAGDRQRSLRKPGHHEAMPRSSETEVTATTGSPSHPAPPTPTRRWSRPCRSALHDVCRQEMQSRRRRIANHAKMRALPDIRADGVGAKNAFDDLVSCHRYARLRPHRIAGATHPLSTAVRHDPAPRFRTSLTNIPALRTRCSFECEDTLTVTSTTVTLGPSGSLHTLLPRDVRRRMPLANNPSSYHNWFPVRSVLTVIVDDLPNQLNPPAISGEMTTLFGKRACDMRLTGTESDSVFAYAASHFGTCAGQPPDENESRRTEWLPRTLASETSPAPASVGLARSGHPPVSPYHGRSTQRASAWHRSPHPDRSTATRLQQRRELMRYSCPVPAYGFLHANPHWHPCLHGVRHADHRNCR